MAPPTPTRVQVGSTDDFNRADAADLGDNWKLAGANAGWNDPMKVSSNQAVPTSDTGNDAHSLYTAAPLEVDQWAQCTLAALNGSGGVGGGIGIVLRGWWDFTGGVGGGWRIVFVTGGFEIGKFVPPSGAYTLLRRVTATFAVSDVVRVEAVGNAFRVYRNGTQVGGDLIDTTAATATPNGIFAGLGFSTDGVTTGWAVDDFSAGIFKDTVVPRVSRYNHPKYPLAVGTDP